MAEEIIKTTVIENVQKEAVKGIIAGVGGAAIGLYAWKKHGLLWGAAYYFMGSRTIKLLEELFS